MATPRTASPADVAHDVAEARIYDGPGRTAWGAILAGSVISIGIYLLLGLLGLGIGFSLLEPEDASPLNGSITTTAVWQFVSQLVALGAGGYAAGRLAGVLHAPGTLLHGAAVWAVNTIAGLWLATSLATGLANTAGSALSSLASGAASVASGAASATGAAGGAVADAVGAVIPDDFALPDLSGAIATEDLPEPVRAALREQGLTPEQFRREARQAFRAVISEGEQRRLREAATSAAADVITSPGDIGQDADAFIDTVLGRGAILGPEDREAALEQMERRFGLSPQEAEQFVDYVQTRAETLQTEAAEAVDTARTEAALAAEAVAAEARDAADMAADALATAALLAALASALGLAAAIGGAMAGRPARA